MSYLSSSFSLRAMYALGFVMLMVTTTTTAFAPRTMISRATTSSSRMQLQAKKGGKSSSSYHLDERELESARRYFERLIGPHLLDQTEMAPVLTQVHRKRRQLEIRLLASLLESDGAIDELMTLWMQPDTCPSTMNSAKCTAALRWMEHDCSDRDATEQTLRDMIQECPTWSEPAARLALLLYSQGRYSESYEYTQKVLQSKPWHFEALQLQVLLFLVSADRAGAIWAARNGMPGLNQRKKRTAWVERAVQMATEQLRKLEIAQKRQQHQELVVQHPSIFEDDKLFASPSSSSSSSSSSSYADESESQPWQ